MLSYLFMQPYEIVGHTADIGVKAYGRTRGELFAHMAEGMFSLIVPPVEVHPRREVLVQAEGEGDYRLLVAWLRELLYLFDTQHFLASSFRIRRMEPNRIQAVVSGEPLDEARHHPDKEVKAVTYCDLAVGKSPDGTWSAQVIFDI